MFVRCGVILIVRVFFYIFTSLTTITTPSLHPDATTLAVGGVQEGLGISLDQSERCERVCHRSANGSQRRTILLIFLFEGRSAETSATAPGPISGLGAPFGQSWGQRADRVPKPSSKGGQVTRERVPSPWTGSEYLFGVI